MGILRAEWQTRTFGATTHEANMSDDSKDEDNEDVEPDPELIDEEMDEEIELDLEADGLLDEDEDDSDEESELSELSELLGGDPFFFGACFLGFVEKLN